MKRFGLFVGIFISIFRLGIAQQKPLQQDYLFFGSEIEKEIWNSEQKNPYQLFKAVNALPDLPDEKWDILVKELDQKAGKEKDQLSLLRTIFQKTHQRLLRKYEQHSSFNAMLSEGKFDCVSGSAALGLLLDRYGYDFDVVETDYHVFIQVRLDEKTIILESTLPVGGMITLPSEVDKYLSAYLPQKDAKATSFNQRLAGQAIDIREGTIFRKVNLTELAGLQYYNDAIVHFNTQQYGQAVQQLSKAYLLYPSDRIEGLRELSIDLAYKTFGYDLRK
ncbi:MAG: hypothetical protein ACK4SF_03335 [Algoriphagus aquaeductus]|uniref:Transglutaminase superfamily protein n=1 Tax=Algoriphagus aquaeductus TaxID=475299 RepID=A0A326RYR4_9BACT|nr:MULTISPECIES: hypothetical protein [Algoriphagus]PZV86501.1 hypothetical protein CLV31_102401 [Algoriphagus aquaeductus]